MNNLKGTFPAEVLDRAVQDKDIRAEDLTPIGFSRLYSDIISMISDK